ncbi:MAG: ABC transporter permease, partial [Chloroflexi bacterium]|nr:ABC transporter permease [Chloroflexota bacterium]
MFDRILPVVRKEFIQIIRDPRTLAIVLLMPPLQIILLGYAVNSDVKHIRTVVADGARDEESRATITAFSNTEYFDIVGHIGGPKEARELIDRGGAKVAFIIPPSFGLDLKSNRVAAIQVIIDGSDPNIAQTAL